MLQRVGHNRLLVERGQRRIEFAADGNAIIQNSQLPLKIRAGNG